MATGRCLCGAVKYEVRGELRDVLLCHCEECRRWHGHVSASAACARDELVLVEERGLRWFDSPESETSARRGFCAECGSSLFWDAPGFDSISIAAGTLDSTQGLRTVSHWFVSQAGDYYDLPDDGLPRHERSGEGELG
ncbi:MAG TPA: GFA family protein [Thermoleophilaceae bacterium]